MTVLLFASAVVVLIVELGAVAGLLELRRELIGRRGYRLASITFGVVAGIAATQAIAIVNAAIALFAPSFIELRNGLFLIAQVGRMVVVVWAAFAIARLARVPDRERRG